MDKDGFDILNFFILLVLILQDVMSLGVNLNAFMGMRFNMRPIDHKA